MVWRSAICRRSHLPQRGHESLSGDLGVELQHRLLEDPVAHGQHVIATGDIERRRAEGISTARLRG